MSAAKKNKIQEMSIRSITVDHGLQSRVATDPEIVKDYADSLIAGSVFPPITVFFDGRKYWLADGFHRLAAYRRVGRDSIPADLKEGEKRDAVLFSVGANAKMGLRPTQADKRKSIMMLLKDDEWFNWSDSSIAKWCGVSASMVGRIRGEFCADNNRPLPEMVKFNDPISGETVVRPRVPGKSQVQVKTSGNGDFYYFTKINGQEMHLGASESEAKANLKKIDAEDRVHRTAISVDLPASDRNVNPCNQLGCGGEEVCPALPPAPRPGAEGRGIMNGDSPLTDAQRDLVARCHRFARGGVRWLTRRNPRLDEADAHDIAVQACFRLAMAIEKGGLELGLNGYKRCLSLERADWKRRHGPYTRGNRPRVREVPISVLEGEGRDTGRDEGRGHDGDYLAFMGVRDRDRPADSDEAAAILSLVHGRDRDIIRMHACGLTNLEIGLVIGRGKAMVSIRLGRLLDRLRLYAGRKGIA